MIHTVAISTALKAFEKSEIEQIAGALGIPIEDYPSKRMVLFSILQKVVVDFTWGDYDDLTKELFATMQIVDGDGRFVPTIIPEEDDYPPCFGFADARDPSCTICAAFIECTQTRESALPECFGLMYDPEADECQMCTDAVRCSGA